MPIQDPYRGNPEIAGAGIPFAVTKSDNDQPVMLRAVRAPSDGDLVLTPAGVIPGVEGDPTDITLTVKQGEYVIGYWRKVKDASTVTGTIVGYV